MRIITIDKRKNIYKNIKKGFTNAFAFDIILRLTLSSVNLFPEKGLSAERDERPIAVASKASPFPVNKPNILNFEVNHYDETGRKNRSNRC